LREERKLRVFENMVLRRIFGPRRDKVTEEWRRLHNEDLNDLIIDVNEIKLTKTKRCILYSLLYNKKVYSLMMAIIEAETCSC